MKLRKKLNFRKGALLTATYAAIIFTSCGQKGNVAQAETIAESSTVQETTVESTTESVTKGSTKGVTPTPTPKKEAKQETAVTYNEEELFDDLLTAVDGYDTAHDYDNILSTGEKETASPKETEAPTPTPTPKETEAPKETKESDNPYIQYDSEGDAFVVVDENGNFVEDPDAPEKYATESETNEEPKEKKEASKDNAEVNEKAVSEVRAAFAESVDEEIINYINEGNFEGAVNSLSNKITTALDFLFYNGKINEHTKKEVDKDTIVFIIGELNNNIAIANDLAPDWKANLSAKYVEAMEFLDAKYIDKFDAIGEEIKKNNPEEATKEEGKSKSK